MMMKSSGVITFVAALLILASCSSVNDNLEKMIPADALGVVSINMPEILNKTGINADGKLAYVLKARDNEIIDIVDKYFLVVSNYDSGKHSLIDYAGNEITSWITPEDYEYADWWS